MIASALVGTAFMVADSVGWFEDIFNWRPDKAWIYIGVFVLFSIVVLIRLVKLQETIDKIKGDVSFYAVPCSCSINKPKDDELPLREGEYSIDITVQFELWTDVDINTAKLFLNVIQISKFWIWQREELLLGLRIAGHDSAIYRKKIRCVDEQPFKDQIAFKWRGRHWRLREDTQAKFELVLIAQSPRVTWKTPVYADISERGALNP